MIHVRTLAVLAALGALAACSHLETAPAAASDASRVTITRTAHGIAHIQAADYDALAYGVAYAHAEDNVCQTADHLVTVRGERSRWFGPEQQGLLGLRMMQNEVIDIFVRAHMDDAALSAALGQTSAQAQALARGYVAGYNRYLADHAGTLPAQCADKPWVQPMTLAEFLRIQEVTMVQIGVGIMADAVIAAAPPASDAAADQPTVQDAVAALAPYQLVNPQLGSNGWAFGAEVTGNGRGVLLGNPHFPWAGTNRFWQLHLTIPGELDVMGASIGHNGIVQIGFNRDIAWTHTVSTGKRFTLHELQLVPGEPTRYVVDGETRAMLPVAVSYASRTNGGDPVQKSHTVWTTDFGPVVVVPRAGLNWSATHAYALQDANSLNLRSVDGWIGINRAASVGDIKQAIAGLGVPWVNTIAADRHGDAMYADVSVVPDVDAERLSRCAPSEAAARLFDAAGLVVLDGSRSDCNWFQDPASPVPGLTPISRMAVAIRRDWVQNSNNSYWLANPAIAWPTLSPLIGPTGEPQSLRTRAGLYEIGARLDATDGIADDGKVGIDEVQAMLFRDRNHAAYLVLDDLLAACATAPEVRAACQVLRDWDRRNSADAAGAALFREWWRGAQSIEDVWRIPFDPAHPVTTPAGLNTDNPAVRDAVIAKLQQAVTIIRDAGFAIDTPLGEVQVRELAGQRVGLHGGEEFEGVLNKLEDYGSDGLTADGYLIDFGSSYIQTVTFDEDGPVAEGMLTYGQSTDESSPWYFDQLALFIEKRWMKLPFSAKEIAASRVGSPLVLEVKRTGLGSIR